MESGPGVRASGASVISSRYSHDELSDHEPEGSTYTASFAPSETLGQTHSTFGLGEDISASFETQRQQYDYSRSLEIEDSLADSLRSSIPDDPLARRSRLVQPILQQQEQLVPQPVSVPMQSPDLQRPLSRSSSQNSGSSTRARPATDAGLDTAGPAAAARVSGDSMRMRSIRASADSMRMRSSTESLPAVDIQRQQPQLLQSEALLPPRPSSSSPVKRPHSSSRSHRHHHSSSSKHSTGGQHPTHSSAAVDAQQAQVPAAAAAAGQQQASRSSSGRSSGKMPDARQQQQRQQQDSKQEQQQQQHCSGDKHTRPKQPQAPVFEGDLSEWGRQNLEDFYDDDDQSITSSQLTMSSGISPRDTRPRVKPFELEAARETFAYNAGMYSRAQALRRDGTAPAAMGVADDLPTRMAYQQLHVLAGMAGKVQDAILHNKRIFEQRMMHEDRFLMRKVFDAWRAVRFGSVTKQQKIKKAAARIMKGALSRAFFAWKDELHIVDKNLAMKRKVTATIARGLMKRCFLAWLRLAEERWWKNQLVMREREVALLEAKIRGYEKRPIQVLKKRKLSAILTAWYSQAEHRRDKRAEVAKAGRFWMNQQLAKAWTSWVDATEQAARRRVLGQKVIARVQKLETTRAWNSWMEVVDAKREHNIKVAKAALKWQNSLTSRAWRTWAERAAEIKARRKIAMRWMQPAKAQAFAGWLDYVSWSKRNRLVVGRALAKLRYGVLASTFFAWVDAVDQSHVEAQITTKEGLQETLAKLQAENERLRRDNERFVRLIDSGEWGRGRVAELVSAGEVMQSERDALLKLIGSLRREYEAVQMAKNHQEEELKHLKEKMTVGGPARNRLLVKGGSSFNALVRAMKQDLVDNGTAAKDPALLYEIDKLSMDRVQVFPDGELNVQAVTTAGTSAAFARPVTKGRGVASVGSPVARAYSGSPSPSPTHARAAAAAGSGAGYFRASSSMSPVPTAAAGVDGLHTTMSVEAGSGAGSAASTQQVLQALSSLSAAQVDQLEAAVKQNALTVAGTPGPLGARGSPLAGSRRGGLAGKGYL